MKRFVFLLFSLYIMGSASGDEPRGYSPVAPAVALNTSIVANVKTVRKWVEEKDFVSALDAMRSLGLAIELYGRRGNDESWRKKIVALQEAVKNVTEALKRKSTGDSDKALSECDRLVADLGKEQLPEPKGPDKSFKAFSTSRVWMDLMQGTYLDARHAETAKEFEHLCQALAEQANAMGYLRSEARWQADCEKVRDNALQAAKTTDDAGARKKALKEVYHACEACHQRTRR